MSNPYPQAAVSPFLTGDQTNNQTPIARTPRYAWFDTVGFWLILSIIIGFLYSIVLLGPKPLQPSNVRWLTPDAACYTIGWELFRQDPDWHWPLTYTARIGYPLGEAAALIDINPFLAVPLKLFSAYLPEPFQYFGLEVVLCSVLQFFFASRLLRVLLGWKPAGIIMCSVFALIAPPLAYRTVGHYSLTNQWLLIAALLLFARAQQPTVAAIRKFAIFSLTLSGIAVAINPYLAFQVLIIVVAGMVALVWQRRLGVPAGALLLVALVGLSVVVAYSLGFFIPGGKGYTSSGYRFYSMNLLAPFDPYNFSSIVHRALPHATDGQYEGYSYLGAGGLALLIFAVWLILYRRHRITVPDRRMLVPLAVGCLVLTLMACSTRITVANVTLADLDPTEKLTPALAILRSSGRLFWLPYYAITAGVLVVPFILLRRSRANLVIASALLLQILDTTQLRNWVHSTVNNSYQQPLKSAVWSELGSTYKHLVVLPAWQCDNHGTPGGLEGYRIFGFLAFDQRMTINSYFAGRSSSRSLDFHCVRSITRLTSEPLSQDSVYVVTPTLASLIADGPTGPGKCHDLDGFILCSAKGVFGLTARLKTAEERLQVGLQEPGFEEEAEVFSAWKTFLNTHVSLSAEHFHSGHRSLAETGEEGSVYQDVGGLDPGRSYEVSAWVSSSRGTTSATQIAVFDPVEGVTILSREFQPAEDWQRLSVTFTASRRGRNRIHLFHKSGNGTVYWDDIQIKAEK